MRPFPIPAAALAVLLFGGTLPRAMADDAEAELQLVRTRVAETFDEIEAKHVQPSPVPGWYTIRKGTIIAYISADGRYLLQGDLIDLDNEINLTAETQNTVREAMLRDIPDQQTIVFAPDHVKYTVSVFTDIDCTYCRRFHSHINEYLAQGIKVRYLMYPRSGPGSASWKKAEEVWCASNRQKALTLAKLDRKFDTRSCDASIVHEQYALGQDVGLQGTPALVLQDGTMISGYLPPAELSQRMASVASVASSGR
jgi:thiol:disulfide interchange protein DsbC